MADFPTSVPSITNPTANDTLAAVPHHEQHEHANDNLAAIATKLGTGSSTPTTSAALMGSGTGASAWRTRYDFHVTDFGADPTGATTSHAAFQAAIDAAEANGGGVVHVAPGYYKWSTEVVANKGVILRGNYSDDSSTTNGSGTTSARPIIQWTGSTGATMYTVVSATAGNVVWGGGAHGIEWDGNSLADTAVHLNAVKYGEFSGKVRRTKVAGVVLSSDNGSAANFGMYNHIPWYEFVASLAGEASHALWIRGNGVDAPSTQHHIGTLQALTGSGHAVYLGESDNVQFLSILGGGGIGPATGQGLYIYNNGNAYKAYHTMVLYIAGSVTIEEGILGTRILHDHVEGSSLTSGTDYWHGEIKDFYPPTRLYRSHGFRLRDYMTIPAGSLVTETDRREAVALQFYAPTLAATGNSHISAIVPSPYDWHNGAIETLELWYSSNGTSAGDLRLTIKCGTPVLLNTAAMVNPSATDTVTIAAATQYQATRYVHTFDTPVPFTKDDTIVINVLRQSDEAEDTNTDACSILGMRIGYVATGPNHSGITFTIPDWQ